MKTVDIVVKEVITQREGSPEVLLAVSTITLRLDGPVLSELKGVIEDGIDTRDAAPDVFQEIAEDFLKRVGKQVGMNLDGVPGLNDEVESALRDIYLGALTEANKLIDACWQVTVDVKTGDLF